MSFFTHSQADRQFHPPNKPGGKGMLREGDWLKPSPVASWLSQDLDPNHLMPIQPSNHRSTLDVIRARGQRHHTLQPQISQALYVQEGRPPACQPTEFASAPPIPPPD